MSLILLASRVCLVQCTFGDLVMHGATVVVSVLARAKAHLHCLLGLCGGGITYPRQVRLYILSDIPEILLGVAARAWVAEVTAEPLVRCYVARCGRYCSFTQ